MADCSRAMEPTGESPSLGDGQAPPAPSPPGTEGFVSRGPGGSRRAQTLRWRGPERDGILSAPTLRGWGLRSCGATGGRALPEGERGAGGIGPCPGRAARGKVHP